MAEQAITVNTITYDINEPTDFVICITIKDAFAKTIITVDKPYTITYEEWMRFLTTEDVSNLWICRESEFDCARLTKTRESYGLTMNVGWKYAVGTTLTFPRQQFEAQMIQLFRDLRNSNLM